MQTLPTYSQLIEDAMRKFIRVLNETEPQFIAESPIQQFRKKILEIIQRTTSILNSAVILNSEQRAVFIRDILLLVYRLVERDNEENVIICLKIIIDYHRLLKSAILNNEVPYPYVPYSKSIEKSL